MANGPTIDGDALSRALVCLRRAMERVQETDRVRAVEHLKVAARHLGQRLDAHPMPGSWTEPEQHDCERAIIEAMRRIAAVRRVQRAGSTSAETIEEAGLCLVQAAKFAGAVVMEPEGTVR